MKEYIWFLCGPVHFLFMFKTGYIKQPEDDLLSCTLNLILYMCMSCLRHFGLHDLTVIMRNGPSPAFSLNITGRAPQRWWREGLPLHLTASPSHVTELQRSGGISTQPTAPHEPAFSCKCDQTPLRGPLCPCIIILHLTECPLRTTTIHNGTRRRGTTMPGQSVV